MSSWFYHFEFSKKHKLGSLKIEQIDTWGVRYFENSQNFTSSDMKDMFQGSFHKFLDLFKKVLVVIHKPTGPYVDNILEVPEII